MFKITFSIFDISLLSSSVQPINTKDKIKDKNLSTEEKKEVLGLIGELSDTDRISLIEEVLNSLNYNFIVTPKEIDFQIDKLSLVISSGINNIIYDKKSVK